MSDVVMPVGKLRGRLCMEKIRETGNSQCVLLFCKEGVPICKRGGVCYCAVPRWRPGFPFL